VSYIYNISTGSITILVQVVTAINEYKVFCNVAVGVSCILFVGCYVSRSMPRWRSTVDLHWVLLRLMLALAYLSWSKLYLISAIQQLLSTASIFLF